MKQQNSFIQFIWHASKFRITQSNRSHPTVELNSVRTKCTHWSHKIDYFIWSEWARLFLVSYIFVWEFLFLNWSVAGDDEANDTRLCWWRHRKRFQFQTEKCISINQFKMDTLFTVPHRAQRTKNKCSRSSCTTTSRIESGPSARYTHPTMWIWLVCVWACIRLTNCCVARMCVPMHSTTMSEARCTHIHLYMYSLMLNAREHILNSI